jgi:endonuclease-3
MAMNNWEKKLSPLLEKYSGKKHPLDYRNRYQLLVMVILAAQDSDSKINKVAPSFFKAFPDIRELSRHTAEDLYQFLSPVRGFRKKSEWIIELAKKLGDDGNIPKTVAGLTALPGVGRKSANVIIRESGDQAEGIVVDLHVVRVASRLGVAEGAPEKIEKKLMDEFPREVWNEIGMALSFHGREICRPKPLCEQCVVNEVCNYYRNVVKADEAKAEK